MAHSRPAAHRAAGARQVCANGCVDAVEDPLALVPINGP